MTPVAYSATSRSRVIPGAIAPVAGLRAAAANLGRTPGLLRQIHQPAVLQALSEGEGAIEGALNRRDDAGASEEIQTLFGEGNIHKLFEEHLAQLPAAATPYEKLESLFNAAEGQLPSRTELLGWHGGRYYNDSKPTEPLAIIQAGMEKEPSGGPLFGKPIRLAYAIVHNANELAKSKIEELEALLEQKAYSVSSAHFGPTGVFTNATDRSFFLPMGYAAEQREVRKIGPYLIQKIVFIAQSGFRPTSSTSYAYYFDKIRPAGKPLPAGDLKDKWVYDLRQYIDSDPNLAVDVKFEADLGIVALRIKRNVNLWEQLNTISKSFLIAQKTPRLRFLDGRIWKATYDDATESRAEYRNRLPDQFVEVEAQWAALRLERIKADNIPFYSFEATHHDWYYVDNISKEAAIRTLKTALPKHWKIYQRRDGHRGANSSDFIVVSDSR